MRFPLCFSSAPAAISAARGLGRFLKKGAREGNMVSLTGASRRRATSSDVGTRAFEQLVARVEGGFVDDGVQQRLERPAEHRSFHEAELDQVGSVHGEIRQAVRLALLLLEQAAQPGRRRELIVRDLLSTQVGVLVRYEVEGQVVAVLAEEATREELVDALEREGVCAHQ